MTKSLAESLYISEETLVRRLKQVKEILEEKQLAGLVYETQISSWDEVETLNEPFDKDSYFDACEVYDMYDDSIWEGLIFSQDKVFRVTQKGFKSAKITDITNKANKLLASYKEEKSE